MLGKSGLVLSTAMIATLSACGGSSSPTASATTGPTSVTPASTQVYSSDAGTAANALASGKTLTTDATMTSKMAAIDYSNGKPLNTKLVDPATVSLKTDTNGDVILTVNGVSQKFTTADLNANKYTYIVNDTTTKKYAQLSAYDGNNGAPTLISGTGTDTKYVQPWEFWTNQLSGNTSLYNEGFFVVGTVTKPADLKGMPTATYSGKAHVLARASSGYTSFNASTMQVESDVKMTANFINGTVNGSLINIRSGPESTNPVVLTSNPGTILMNNAPISGNGFSGTVTPDSTFASTASNPTISSGTYSGNFFGPAADEVGGTLSLTGTNTSGAFNANGVFTATKN